MSPTVHHFDETGVSINDITSVPLGIMCASVAWTLWIRRRTWHMYWENAATLNIGLLGAGTALLTSSTTIGRVLYAITDQHNLEQWIAHWCFLGATAALILHTQKRRTSLGERLRTQYKQRIVMPFTLGVPVSLALFYQSPEADRVWPDDGSDGFLDIKIFDGWICAYWLSLTAMFCYLGTILVKGLIVVRRNRRNRWCANFYLAVIALGVSISAAVTVATFDGMPIDTDNWVIPCAATYTTFLALIAAISWQRKQHLAVAHLVA